MNVLRKVVARDATVAIRFSASIRWQRTSIRRSFAAGFVTRSNSPCSVEPIGTVPVAPPVWSTRYGQPIAWTRSEVPGRCFSTNPDDLTAIVQDSHKRIQASALQGDALQAQEILNQLEGLLKASASSPEQLAAAEESLLESREAVLDAWISYQNTLYQDYLDNPTTTAKTAIVHAAQAAHHCLEQTTPFLTPRIVDVSSRKPNHTTVKGSQVVESLLEDPDGVLGKLSTTNPNSNSKRTNPRGTFHRCQAVLGAWAKASRVEPRQGIPQRATYLLQRMEAATSTNHSKLAVTTTTDSYNRVLEAWAWSREHLRGTMAEQIFQSMLIRRKNSSSNSSSPIIIKPNGESYQWIIHAWCNSQQKKAAVNASKHLMKWWKRLEKRQEQNPITEPTVETYRMVLKAWIHADDRNAPIKALEMLRNMEKAFNDSYCTTVVDETCYRNYLLASARRSQLPEQGLLADQILTKLKNQQIIPDEDFYTAAIQIWKHSALNPLFSRQRETCIARAVELLQELSLAHHRSTLVSIRPKTQNYNDVLEALAASRKAVSRGIAEALVQVMEQSSLSTEEDSPKIQPNADTYKWLLMVHAASRASDKVQASKQVLERMKSVFAGEDEEGRAPIVGVYNAFIQVCASVDGSSKNLLSEALGAVQEMRSLYQLKPDSQTYGNLLRVCKEHLEIGSERSRIVQSIFEACCEEGLVDEYVLKSLKGATSEAQYFNLVVAVSEGEEGTRIVPDSWTANVGLQEIRRVTASGRKSIPLTVEGKFTVTTAMKEDRMRKLRSKKNQRILRAGRLKLDGKKMSEPIIIYLDE